jgi:hypothetical protein
MARPFWWFQGDSVAALRIALEDAGPNPRLEVHIDPAQQMRLYVFRDGETGELAEGGGGGGINDAHICPPQCP